MDVHRAIINIILVRLIASVSSWLEVMVFFGGLDEGGGYYYSQFSSIFDKTTFFFFLFFSTYIKLGKFNFGI